MARTGGVALETASSAAPDAQLGMTGAVQIQYPVGTLAFPLGPLICFRPEYSGSPCTALRIPSALRDR